MQPEGAAEAPWLGRRLGAAAAPAFVLMVSATMMGFRFELRTRFGD